MKDTLLHTGRIAHSPYLWAILSVFIGLMGQFFLVTVNYGGNWTGLFRTGDKFTLASGFEEYTYVFNGSPGYDGQFYRYVAHDPLGTKGFWKHVDSPAIRYSRIFVPGISYLIAFGKKKWIDTAYYLVVLLCLFFGSLFLSKWAMLGNGHPAWGPVFMVLPGTVISLWMMTGEISLLALTTAFAFFWRSGCRMGIYITLILSALCRETGLILTAGLCLWFLIGGEYRNGILYATAVIPAGIWYAYIHCAMPGASSVVPTWLVSQPTTGIIHAFLEPETFARSDHILFWVRFFDRVSILGMLVLFFMALRNLWKLQLSPITLSAGLHVLLGIVVNNVTFWRIPLGYTRPFSTLLLLAGLQCMTSEPSTRDKLIISVSILAVSLRIILQLIYTEGTQFLH